MKGDGCRQKLQGLTSLKNPPTIGISISSTLSEQMMHPSNKAQRGTTDEEPPPAHEEEPDRDRQGVGKRHLDQVGAQPNVGIDDV